MFLFLLQFLFLVLHVSNFKQIAFHLNFVQIRRHNKGFSVSSRLFPLKNFNKIFNQMGVSKSILAFIFPF